MVLEESPFNLSSISREVLVCDRADCRRTEYPDRVGEKRNHTPASYRSPGICETGDDEHPVECSEI